MRYGLDTIFGEDSDLTRGADNVQNYYNESEAGWINHYPRQAPVRANLEVWQKYTQGLTAQISELRAAVDSRPGHKPTELEPKARACLEK